MIKERLKLSVERITEIVKEQEVQENYVNYFKETAQFLLDMDALYKEIEHGVLQTDSLVLMQERNNRLYEDILSINYDKSYANPTYAVRIIGEEYGKLLSFLYTELRSIIIFAYEKRVEEIAIRMELYLEIFQAFVCAYQEKKSAPVYEEVQQIVYWFISDYYETQIEQRVKEQLDSEENFAAELIMKSDLSDMRYLYRYGEYISDNEIQIARHLLTLSQETITLMADTYTEGYRLGFINNNKDLSKKKTVNIRYCLGFERVIRKAIENFEAMGLAPVIYRAPVSVFYKKGMSKIGYYGAIANKQYDYDHKEDEALFLDHMLINRKLEVMKHAYETYKELAYVHAGPAVMEVFGQAQFVPENKKEAYVLSKKQQKLCVEYSSKAGELVNEYIKGDERSFTIIAFPVPEIGEKFTEIFDEVIKINTLDYKLYEAIQQTLIDTLDTLEYVEIIGSGSNKTDLKVFLYELKNKEKETIFENCVADVNIPVGEVFTSPRLKGTTGVLYVSRVYLNELEYKNLEIHFENGMVTDYLCSNFQTEEENKKYVRDNVLYHHESLPIGEFAIGTNTTAYVTAKKYGIEDKLPILIAEKMGPHFALGDTCYHNSEDTAVYNPDGKEIVARDNEISILRKTDKQKAYVNCHTDITIPYDELKAITGVTKEGIKIPIIENGRFVLAGSEKLNDAFLQLMQ